MKVFDFGRNLPSVTSHLLCSQEVRQQIADARELSEHDAATWNGGIQIEVVQDPFERKAAALLRTATTGYPTLFENENGDICEVSMPTPSFNPFRFLKRN